MWVYWKRGGHKVFVYGLHKNALGAMNLLNLSAPAMELKVLDFGHEVTIPIRELLLLATEVMDLNRESDNDNH